MSKDFFLANDYTDSRPIELESVPVQGLRVYRSGPDYLALQLRTHTKKQGRIAHQELSRSDAVKLVARLQMFISRQD